MGCSGQSRNELCAPQLKMSISSCVFPNCPKSDITQTVLLRHTNHYLQYNNSHCIVTPLIFQGRGMTGQPQRQMPRTVHNDVLIMKSVMWGVYMPSCHCMSMRVRGHAPVHLLQSPVCTKFRAQLLVELYIHADGILITSLCCSPHRVEASPAWPFHWRYTSTNTCWVVRWQYASMCARPGMHVCM